MRYRELPDHVVWPCLLSAVTANLVAGVGAAISPTLLWLAFLVGGVLVWYLMSRYYSSRHEAVSRVFLFGGLPCTSGPLSRHAAWLSIGLVLASGLAWLAVVGLEPALPVGMSVGESLAVAAVVLTAPINEEVIFRGALLFGLIASGCRPVSAVVIQATLFALLHGSQGTYQIVTRFIGGLAYGLTALHYGGLWHALGLHIGWNTIEQLRAFLSGGFQAGAAVHSYWHTGLPSVIGMSMSVVLFVLLNRRYDVNKRLAPLAEPRTRTDRHTTSTNSARIDP